MTHNEPPSPTNEDPTTDFSATTAGVGANGVELDVHKDAPDKIRNTDSHTNREAQAS